MVNGLVKLVIAASLTASVSCGGSYDQDLGQGSIPQLRDVNKDVPGAIISIDVQDQLPVVVPNQEEDYRSLQNSPTVRSKQSFYDSFMEKLNEGISRSGFWYHP